MKILHSLLATVCLVIADVSESVRGEKASAGSLAISAPLWIIGLVGVVVASSLPAGARITAQRPTLSRLVLVNVCVTAALWVATWIMKTGWRIKA